MIVTVPGDRAQFEGLRPVDLSRDLSQIVNLLRAVFGESMEAEEREWLGDASVGGVNQVLYRFNPSAARLANGFVWQAEGRIVGNVTLLPTKIWDRFLVANVAVYPEYRRRGIARALMEAVTDAVRARRGRVILLQVVKNNQPAIDLYRRLGYHAIGNMTTWHASASRLRQIPSADGGAEATPVRPLPGHLWRAAYQLDTACVGADLNWPEPIPPDVYHRTWWRRAGDFLNGRQVETWTTTDQGGRLCGLATISSEFGRSHLVSVRVDERWAERHERLLVAKVLRRLNYLPRRNVRIDHPDSDEVMNALLREANFTVQRTLTHMRLDVD